MWTVGQEKKIQLELSVLDLSRTELIEHIWSNLLTDIERKEFDKISAIHKLYIMLKMSFLYGENTKTFNIVCPHCQNATEFSIDCAENLKFEDGELEVEEDLPIKEYKEKESKLGLLEIDTSAKCVLCNKDIHINIGLDKLIKEYLFAYSIKDFLELILFFKEYNFSISEIESLIPLEVQALTNMIIEREKQKEEQRRLMKEHQGL